MDEGANAPLEELLMLGASVNTAPTVEPASPKGCSLHREDLDQYLSISGYGSNVAMFNCYFVREGPNTPPLCIACRRTIGDHPSRNPALLPCPAPTHMTIGVTRDVARLPFAQGTAIDFAIFFSVILAAQIIALAATSMFWRSPIVLICPGTVGFMLVLLLYLPKAYMLTFHKGLGLGPHSRVDIEERRLLGCSKTRSTTVGELGYIDCRWTAAGYCRQVFEVVACAPIGRAMPLFRGCYDECEPQFAAWQHYLTHYGVAPQGGMPRARPT